MPPSFETHRCAMLLRMRSVGIRAAPPNSTHLYQGWFAKQKLEFREAPYAQAHSMFRGTAVAGRNAGPTPVGQALSRRVRCGFRQFAAAAAGRRIGARQE